MPTPTIPRDDALLQYATPRQREIMEAYWRLGSKAAAKEMGLNPGRFTDAIAAVKKAAARKGYAPEHNHQHTVPDGYKLKGTSTLYREGEPVLQWVKTTEDRERQEAILREVVAGLSSEIPRAAPIARPDSQHTELCAVYPVGDHHLGMYAWHEEAGGDYDMKIAERLLVGAFDALTRSLPKAKHALVAFLGDFFHYDSLTPVTPTHKNILDADGRYALMVRTGVRIIRASVDAVLRRHETAHVVFQAGNHDLATAVFVTECLAALYENDPRITVDRSPAQFHYYRHGENLVGVCHGHEVKKLDELPLIMAADRAEDWGQTRHRWWLTGHTHQDRLLDVKGTRIESFRILPPSDAWAHNKGYRPGREMKAALLHSTHGEVQRVSVRPEMIA